MTEDVSLKVNSFFKSLIQFITFKKIMLSSYHHRSHFVKGTTHFISSLQTSISSQMIITTFNKCVSLPYILSPPWENIIRRHWFYFMSECKHTKGVSLSLYWFCFKVVSEFTYPSKNGFILSLRWVVDIPPKCVSHIHKNSTKSLIKYSFQPFIISTFIIFYHFFPLVHDITFTQRTIYNMLLKIHQPFKVLLLAPCKQNLKRIKNMSKKMYS